MYLAIRTDAPQAYVALYDGSDCVDEISWEAHKALSDTLLLKIEALLSQQKKQFDDITGVIVYKGHGSFTGLRIGITAANSIAQGLQIPIVGVGGESWIADGARNLTAEQNDTVVVPEYGAEPNITKPRK